MRPFYLLLACLFLANCGSQEDAELGRGPRTALSYTEEQLEPWRRLCIDAHLVDADTPEKIQALHYAWDQVVLEAEAELEECVADWRVNDEFCAASYDKDLSFFVQLYCDRAF